MDAIPYEEIIRIIYHVCFDTHFFGDELERTRLTLFHHLFTVELAYLSHDIRPRRDDIAEAISTFGTKSIAAGCARVINGLDDQGWRGKGNVCWLFLLEGLYDNSTAELRRDFLEAEIASVVVRRSWRCFKNPEIASADHLGDVEIITLYIQKLVHSAKYQYRG